MEENKVISNSFLWMAMGLVVTFLTGFIVSSNANMLANVFDSLYIFCIIAELVLVIVLSSRVMKMKPTTAKIVFLLYSFVSGLTFSSIFVVYQLSSIITVFLISAVVFGIMALIGYTTKINLAKIGTYFIFGMIALCIIALANMFMHYSYLELVICICCVLLFIGITAYDVQKIKSLSNSGLPEDNLAIYGALDLYLDFINIFIDLLRLFGKSDR